MDSWLHVTGVDGTMGLIPLSKIAYIDEGYDHGGSVIFLPGTEQGRVAVKETLEEIIQLIKYLARSGDVY